VVHEVSNLLDAPIRAVNALPIDKGKPRMQPVPQPQ
jgi:hypothetical protein